MVYLSSIPLNPMRKATGPLLQNPQRVHAHLMGASPEQPVPHDPNNRQVLWRWETVGNDDPAYADAKPIYRANLLVLTKFEPSWSALIEACGWPDTEAGKARIADYSRLFGAVTLGRQFSFKVTANPVSSVRTLENPTQEQQKILDRPRGRITVGHRTVTHQMEWFLDRAAADNQQWGFTVGPREDAKVKITGRTHLQFYKYPKKEGSQHQQPVSLNQATYEGILQVTDVELFKQTLLQGIGRGKAYGNGLLTIANP
ncbi:MAG: type I-E CRISPR-associated protein Cas6/Cse3/CasE [Actinomycetaceae bacterium]|nr:type I-E CRISPR-associated protein Cas6/Cse3/CasE [Actinomycetaceae bacterium]